MSDAFHTKTSLCHCFSYKCYIYRSSTLGLILYRTLKKRTIMTAGIVPSSAAHRHWTTAKQCCIQNKRWQVPRFVAFIGKEFLQHTQISVQILLYSIFNWRLLPLKCILVSYLMKKSFHILFILSKMSFARKKNLAVIMELIHTV
jgi:hypothetical protein